MGKIIVDRKQVNDRILPNIKKVEAYLDDAQTNQNTFKSLLPKSFNNYNNASSINALISSAKNDTKQSKSKISEKLDEIDSIESSSNHKTYSLVSTFNSSKKSDEEKDESDDDSLSWGDIWSGIKGKVSDWVDIEGIVKDTLADFPIDSKYYNLLCKIVTEYVKKNKVQVFKSFGNIDGTIIIGLLTYIKENYADKLPLAVLVKAVLPVELSNEIINKLIDILLANPKEGAKLIDLFMDSDFSKGKIDKRTLKKVLPSLITLLAEMKVPYSEIKGLIPKISKQSTGFINLDDKYIEVIYNYAMDDPDNASKLINVLLSIDLDDFDMNIYVDNYDLLSDFFQKTNIKYSDIENIVPGITDVIMEKANGALANMGFGIRLDCSKIVTMFDYLTGQNEPKLLTRFETLFDIKINYGKNAVYHAIKAAFPNINEELSNFIYREFGIRLSAETYEDEFNTVLKNFLKDLNGNIERVNQIAKMSEVSGDYSPEEIAAILRNKVFAVSSFGTLATIKMVIDNPKVQQLVEIAKMLKDLGLTNTEILHLAGDAGVQFVGNKMADSHLLPLLFLITGAGAPFVGTKIANSHQFQELVENAKMLKDLGLTDMEILRLVGATGVQVVGNKIEAAWDKSTTWVSNKWDETTDWVSDKWDETTDWVADTAVETWDSVTSFFSNLF